MADTELRIRIKPEMMSSARGQLANIKSQATGGAEGGGALSALQGMKGVGGVAKLMPAITAGVAGIAAITGGIALVVKALMSYKPLMAMISAIVKLLQLFLRPIADVIIVLLMPILYILKPILMVANQLIAPYRRLAFQMLAAGGKAMQEGDVGTATKAFGGAFMTMFAGINVFLIGIFSQVVKLVIAGLAELLKSVTSELIRSIGTLLAFIPGVGSKVSEAANQLADNIDLVIDKAAQGANMAIDVAGTALVLANATAIAKLADKLGVVTKEQLAQFITGVANSVKSVFGSDITQQAVDKWTDAMIHHLDLMDTAVVAKLEEVGKDIEAATAKLTQDPEAGGGTEEKADKAEKAQKGFWAKLFKSIAEIFLWSGPFGLAVKLAIEIWGTKSKETMKAQITGADGLVDATKFSFEGITREQDNIVKPIVDLVSRLQTEMNQINDVSIPDFSSRLQSRISRSF